MTEKVKWNEVVSRLIELTQNGELKWETIALDEGWKEKPDDRIRESFVTEYRGRRLILYKRVREIMPHPDAVNYGIAPDRPYWVSDVILELGSDADRPAYAVSRTRMLKDLLEAVKYQVADVAGFVDDLLGEEDF